MKLNIFQKSLFFVFGIISLIANFLGLYIILLLLAIMFKAYLLFFIIAVVFISTDFYRHSIFKKNGYTGDIGRYKKEKL